MSNRYPPLNPQQIVRESNPEDATREALRTALSRLLGAELQPDQPRPMLLGFPLTITRPPDRQSPPGTTGFLMNTLIMPRCPGIIEFLAQRHLRPDCTLHVQHATVRGTTHALLALSDGQLKDEGTKYRDTLLPLPPNPIGWALQRAADNVGAACRHWKLKGGTETWKAMLRETRAAEAHLGIPQGSIQETVRRLSAITTPREAADIADLLEEMGLTSQEDTQED